MADPLHFGDFAGLTSKIVYFVFGIGLSGLCLTGVWLHVKRLERDRKGRAAWPGGLVAVAMTYAMLVGTALAGAEEIKSYGPVIDGVQRWPEVPVDVTAFLTIWTLATVAILAVFTAILVRAFIRIRRCRMRSMFGQFARLLRRVVNGGLR